MLPPPLREVWGWLLNARACVALSPATHPDYSLLGFRVLPPNPPSKGGSVFQVLGLRLRVGSAVGGTKAVREVRFGHGHLLRATKIRAWGPPSCLRWACCSACGPPLALRRPFAGCASAKRRAHDRALEHVAAATGPVGNACSRGEEGSARGGAAPSLACAAADWARRWRGASFWRWDRALLMRHPRETRRPAGTA